jgi:cysteinyl-tRNA synthetase
LLHSWITDLHGKASQSHNIKRKNRSSMAHPMKKRFILVILPALFFTACSLIETISQGDDDPSSNDPGELISSEGAELLDPSQIDEQVTCTYFVAPNGHDDAAGSESQPWGSFQHAADSAEPGDTVCFRGGNYFVEDTIRISESGTTDDPIVYIAYPGERPAMDGGNEVGGLLIVGQGASYLRISGFMLHRFTDWGVDLEGENRYIRLDHLVVEGGEAGVHFTYGSDKLAPPEGGPVEYVILEQSLILDSEYTAIDCTPGPCNHMIIRQNEVHGSGVSGEASFGADGISFARGYPVLIEDNYVHDNGGDGIDLNSRDREGYASGVVVRRNQVVRNHQNGIKLWAGGRIENNIVWGQGNSALWLGTFHSELEVINNTIAFNMWDPVYSGRNWAFTAGYPEEIVALPQVDLLLVNNIFAYNTGPDVGDPTGIYFGPGVTLTEHHNLYFSREDGEITAEFLEREFSRLEIEDGFWVSQTGQGSFTQTNDPFFSSSWPQVDLNLQEVSPAIDAGDPELCPSEDLHSHPRPVDGNGDGQAVCDIGALEALAEDYIEHSQSPLQDVETWLYYIDVNLSDDALRKIIDSTYDMVVIDYITSEQYNSDYPLKEAIKQMHSAQHSKLVMAYIDVGQVEDFRTYWEPGWRIGDPEWIIALDPDGWEGNYPAAYWWDEYRNLWLGEEGYLQGIIDAGFDGVYLDWIEAYSDENVVAFARGEGVDPLQEMIWWVGDIAKYTRAQDPNFVVIAQNAAELARFDEYIGIIDAIAQEQVWFDGAADNNPPGDCPLPATEDDVDSEAYYESLSPGCQRQYDEFPESTLHMSSEEYLNDLKIAQDKGLKIFTVDYATDPVNIEAVYRNARMLGFVPFVSNRALDQYVEPVP